MFQFFKEKQHLHNFLFSFFFLIFIVTLWFHKTSLELICTDMFVDL